jgi:hypothetical protein
VADAILDRIVHGSHRIVLKGPALHTACPPRRSGATNRPAAPALATKATLPVAGDRVLADSS